MSSCESCRHWRPKARHRTQEERIDNAPIKPPTHGECRRFPPNIPNIGDDGICYGAVHPETLALHECGEHQALAE